MTQISVKIKTKTIMPLKMLCQQEEVRDLIPQFTLMKMLLKWLQKTSKMKLEVIFSSVCNNMIDQERESRRNVNLIRRQPTEKGRKEDNEFSKDILDQIMQEEMEIAFQDEEDERFDMNMNIISSRQMMASVMVPSNSDFDRAFTMGKLNRKESSPKNSLAGDRRTSLLAQKKQQARFS